MIDSGIDELTPQKFLEYTSNPDNGGRPFKLGTVASGYVANTGRPSIMFDGETTTTTRKYPYLASYNPTAGDRVLLAPVGKSYVIIGTVGPATADIRLSGSAGYVAQSPNGTYWKLTPTDSGATSWTVV